MTTERNFSTFGFIHNKVRNRLQNNHVKKLVFIYENLWMYKGEVLKHKKNKLIYDQQEFDNNNDNNNNDDNDNNNDNDLDDDRFIGLELNITDLTADE